MDFISKEDKALCIEVSAVNENGSVAVAYGKQMDSAKKETPKKLSGGKQSIRDRLK